MKKSTLLLILSLTVLFSCSEKSGPDVSKIEVKLETVRFEKDFFSIDTNDIQNSIQKVFNKNPAFFRDYMQHILGVSQLADSGEQAIRVFRQFIHDYRPVYDSVNKVFPDLTKYEGEIIEGLKHVKYYFPVYPLPEKLITFIGPMDAYFEASMGGYGDVITTDGLGVGLQLHLGKNFSMYTSEMGLALFPAYISRKFSPEYISVNCIKNIIDDMYPDQSTGKTLIEQFVEKGKRMYLLDKLMPRTHDTLKIGYTSKQLEGCRENEGLIWSYFVKNGLTYNNDPSLIKNYIGDSPGTPELGEGAPGYIGLFIGWQIVKKFMDEHELLKLDKLMMTDARLIFEQSKYRPT